MLFKTELKRRFIDIITSRRFMLLFALQLIFLLAIFGTTSFYQIKILEDVSGVLENLDQANFDPTQIQAGTPILESLAGTTQAYDKMMGHLKEFALIMLLIFATIYPLLWYYVYRITKIQNTNLRPKRFYLKFQIINLLSAFVLLSIIVLLYLYNQNNLSQESISNIGKIILASFLIIHYFWIIAISNLHLPPKKLVKRWNQEVFKIKNVISFLIIIIILTVSLFALYFLIPISTLVSIMTIILFIAFLAGSKVYWLINFSPQQ